MTRMWFKPPDRSTNVDDWLPLFGGGFALGGVALVACAMIDALALALYDYLAGDDPLSWPTAAVVALTIVAVIVSALGARWLLGLRRWIGNRGDPAELEVIESKRRSFTIGAMSLYLLGTPFLWVLVVAIASSAV